MEKQRQRKKALREQHDWLEEGRLAENLAMLKTEAVKCTYRNMQIDCQEEFV